MADRTACMERYRQNHIIFEREQRELVELVDHLDLRQEADRKRLIEKVQRLRMQLKAQDFWLRYLEPVAYRKLNGPLPVEWETEVFEKYEAPYRREGAGLTLFELALEDPQPSKESLKEILIRSQEALPVFLADSITRQLEDPSTFYFANRLFLLNLAAIYTTGFECPDTSRILPELKQMMRDVEVIYRDYASSAQAFAITKDYWDRYHSSMDYLNRQSDDFSRFDHFTWLRDHVNPLFRINQQMIKEHGLYPKSYMDYSLNDSCRSIFDKKLFSAQQSRGLYAVVEDEEVLDEIRETGKLLFYDPILSSNNQRSCASCHQPSMLFTDTTRRTALQLDGVNVLPRNTLSLVNTSFNHLLMQDGKHIDLLEQAKSVIAHPLEMGKGGEEILAKVMSCPDYRNAFRKWMRYVPGERAITMEHIASALSVYYTSFSSFTAPFDEAMDQRRTLSSDAINGFNLFMGKAQCGTCHFVPIFNGVKPPYTSSEFEVLGVPEDTSYLRVSKDAGRHGVHSVPEMLHAFRTGTVRNSLYTAPYMHNGVFQSLHQVMDFYNKGGALGRGLPLPNQTLSAAPLGLTDQEIDDILAFLGTLNEQIPVRRPPADLPRSTERSLNTRKVGGVY